MAIDSGLGVGLAGRLDILFSFAAPCAIILWSVGESVVIGPPGVAIRLTWLPFTPFFAAWQQIKRIDFVSHGKRTPSAAIHFRWALLPLTFTIHAKRYPNGLELLQTLRNEASARGIEITDWYSPDDAPLAAVALMAWGAMFSIAMQNYEDRLMRMYAALNFPLSRFNEIPAPILLASLYVASVACYGAALGVLSAFHQASFRPFLLALFLLIGVRMLPDPILHWLVCFAIYAILLARLQPVGPIETPTFPSDEKMQLAMNIVLLAPAIAGAAYGIGVLLACRRRRELM